MRKIILAILFSNLLFNNKTVAQNWSALGQGIGIGLSNNSVYSVSTYNGELFAAGYFTSAGGSSANNIAKWDGANWSAVGSGTNGPVGALTTYNGNLYAGGSFNIAGGVSAIGVAQWNGTSWSAVGSANCSEVSCFATYNNELYVAGHFPGLGGPYGTSIAKWNGSSWTAVGSENEYYTVSIKCMTVYNGHLYAAGAYYAIGGGGVAEYFRITKWNGNNWSTLLTIPASYTLDGALGDVLGMAVYNNELYVAGNFVIMIDTIPANQIAKWNEISWSSVGTGINFESWPTGGGDGSAYSFVRSLTVFDGALYAGGHFDSCGTIATRNIAKWNGSSWSPLGQGINGFIYDMIGIDSSLYVGGWFNFVNGTSIPANNIAKWSDYCFAVLPTPDPISGNNVVCQNSSQTYSVNPVPGATSYTWVLPAGWTGTSNTNSITATPGANSGTIFVAANNTYCSSNPQTLTVTVNPLPSAPGSISGNNAVCQNSTQNYSVNPVPAATSYTWILPSGWTGGSNTNTITVTAGTNSGLISVTADNSCGSSIPQTLAITVVTDSPTLGPIIGNSFVCQNSSQIFSVNPVSGATGYTWNLPAGWIGNSTTNSITATPGPNSGLISVTANNNCGSSSPQTLAVTVNPLPSTPGPIIGNNSVCQNSSQTYSINPVSVAASYTWTLPSGWTGNSTTNSITAVAGANSGNISVTASNSCGSSSPQTLAVTANPLPPTPDPISGNIFVCENSVQTYSIPPVSGASDYTWTLPPGWTGSSSSNSITVLAGSNSGNVSVRANSNCGNSLAQDLQVSVFPDTAPPTPQLISGNTFVFSGQKENYSVSNINGVTKYTWSVFGGGVIIQGQNSNSISVNWQASGNYILSVKASNNCNTSEEQKIYINVSDSDTRDPFEIKVIPNLSSGEFYLKAKGIQDKLIKIEVMNMSGQFVYQKNNLHGTNNYSQLLNLSMLAQGLYIVKIAVDEKVYIRKIVINR